MLKFLIGVSIMEEKCDVVGCSEPAFKSVPSSYLPLFEQLKIRVEAKKKRIKLCRNHYKEIKKIRRKVRKTFF